MTPYFTGKNYGVSTLTDVSGRPLLTYTDPFTKKTMLLADRVAQTFDFTVAQPLTAGAATNQRMASAVSSAAKALLGGGSDDELDHKISLELGGSNTPANLFIQHGITAGPSAASDTLENNLALDVVAGKISLLTAWRTLEDQKGFLLAEDIKTGASVDIALLMLSLAGNLKDYITGKKKAALGTGDASLKQTMDQLLADLAKAPLDQTKLEGLISTQVAINQQTLNISKTDAQQVTKTAIASYAESKGVDPREIIAATNINIQSIINNSKNSPNIYGISTPAIAAIMTALAGTLSAVGIVAFAVAIIGVIYVGPTAIAGALSGGLFESIGGLIGVSPVVGIAFATVAITEGTAAMMFLVGQGIKSVYDAGYLLPTQNITAMKDALAIQKGLAGFLPSLQQPGNTSSTASKSTTSTTVGNPQPTYSPATGEGTVDGDWIFKNNNWVKNVVTSPSGSGGSSGSGSVTGTSVHVSVISGGKLGQSPTYVPNDSDVIENATSLQSHAEQNLANYLSSLPGSLVYEIRLVGSVILQDGTVRIGTKQSVQHGVTKKGKVTYKTVTNKFAVADIYHMNLKGARIKIDEIVLGSIDEASYSPDNLSLATITTTLQTSLVTNKLTDITQINIAQATPQNVTVAGGVDTTNLGSSATSALQPKTLSEYYASLGQTVPTIQVRGLLYQQLGLGTSNMYVGNVEQNTSLLTALLAKSVVTGSTSTVVNAAPPSVSIPNATAEQIANRTNPIAVTISLPQEGQVFRAVGDDQRTTLYKIINGVVQNIGVDVLVPNTDVVLIDGTIAKAGIPNPNLNRNNIIKSLDPNYTGTLWSHINAGDNYDATNGAGAYNLLPAFNIADLTTVANQYGGKLPTQASVVLN